MKIALALLAGYALSFEIDSPAEEVIFFSACAAAIVVGLARWADGTDAEETPGGAP